MTTLDISDIGLQVDAFWAEKRPLAVKVKFATSLGKLDTREGLVQFMEGDAILIGVEGESWPIPRDKFLQTYQAIPPTISGLDGDYVKRPMRVLCIQIVHPLEIKLTSERGTLKANPGDYLVQYKPGDLAVVGESIFLNSYQILT